MSCPDPGGCGTDLTRSPGNAKYAASRPSAVAGKSGLATWIGEKFGRATRAVGVGPAGAEAGGAATVQAASSGAPSVAVKAYCKSVRRSTRATEACARTLLADDFK